MMTRTQRNHLIDNLGKELSSIEKRAFKAISALIDDTTTYPYEIDLDDLSECTGMEYDMVEEILDHMYDLNILSVLDYENGEIS